MPVRLILLLLLLTCMGAGSAQAQRIPTPSRDVERITDFDVLIDVQPDGALEITEVITFDVKGYEIQRGIIRNLPRTAPDNDGVPRRVPLSILEVRRNDAHEPYKVESTKRMRNVRIGDPDYYLPHGQHTYTIRYRYERVLLFREDETLLRWDVTGNEWTFPIEQASAHVRLPEQVPAGELRLDGFTGDYGVTRKDFTAVAQDGAASFASTSYMNPGEGLTIQLAMPPGLIPEPTAAELRAQRLADLSGLLYGFLGFLAVGFYFLLAWFANGRDPRAGAIVPLFEPPDELAPASMRYLRRLQCDSTALTATLVSMARKGYLTIEEDVPDEYALKRAAADESVLGPEELAVAKALFGKKRTEVVVSQENQEKLAAGKSALNSWLNLRFGKEYYLRNGRQLLVGVGLSVLALVIVLGATPDGVLIDYPWQIFVTVALLLGMNIVFAKLLPAYTERARAKLDLIEGFRVALSYKGKAHWPGDLMNPEMFERYLPYAIALDVETEFAHGFDKAMASAGQPVRQQQPTWYHSPWDDHFHYNRFSRSLGRDFNRSLSSASTPPSSGSSSSGGGGGFSGGGGGGGGGSGW